MRRWSVVYQSPDEKPPGGTLRWPPAGGSGCGWAWRWGAAGAGGAEATGAGATGAAGAATGAGAGAGAWTAAGGEGARGLASCLFCCTRMFGSTVFMQKFRFDEFCWSYLGRGLITGASDSPKRLVWPPPGGFSTRLELLSLPSPMLNDVEVIFAKS